MTLELGDEHLVVGKYDSSYNLAADEIASIQNTLARSDFNNLIVYDRVLISGIIYKTTNYQRQTKCSDHVLSFIKEGQKLIGLARKFLSVCDSSCISCSLPCKHIVIIESLPLLNIQDSLHIVHGNQHHYVGLARYVSAQLCIK